MPALWRGTGPSLPATLGGVGAFDTYEAAARCSGCGDVHYLGGQTKFFDPDFGGLCHRHFAPGVPQPIEQEPDEFGRADVWEDEWIRLAPPGEPGVLRVLADWDELYQCTCGVPLAIVLRYRLAAGSPRATATLEAIELLDALADPRALAVDFCERTENLWVGDRASYDALQARLAAVRDRLGRVRAGLVERLGGTFEPSPPWTHVGGPTRCEACGRARERLGFTLLAHPDLPRGFFGEAPLPGLLRPGDAVACALDWLADDVDRGYWMRLRHPVPGDSLRLITRRCSWGCSCGAGPASFVMHFAREAAGVRLAALTLRVVRGRADLEGLDFAEAPMLSRDPAPSPYPRWLPGSREEAIAALLAGEFRVYAR